MSELCNPKCHFSSLVISDFILLCSFILSHPLYFSYFIFFSPYLLKLISFLSPLFVTTFLLSLAFLTGFVHAESSQTLFTSILQRLQFNKDCPNEEDDDDDLGIYELVFGPPPSMAAVSEEGPSQILDQTQQKDCILKQKALPGSGMEDPIIAKTEDFEENKVSLKPEVPRAVVMEEKRLENFLKILDEFERLTSNVEEKKKKRQEPPRGAKSDKVVEKQKSLFMNGSEAADRNKNDNHIQTNDAALQLESAKGSPAMAKSRSQRISDDLSSFGSMRREREWKRTLACKLFEERHNAAAAGGGGGGEAMDSLWEAYEADSDKLNKRRSEKVKRAKNAEREWKEDDGESGGAQLCCLQALKLSAGKMNLGVGKPNLVKISKAIKGIGWLHNLTKTSKKVHNNGDHRF